MLHALLPVPIQIRVLANTITPIDTVHFTKSKVVFKIRKTIAVVRISTQSLAFSICFSERAVCLVMNVGDMEKILNSRNG